MSAVDQPLCLFSDYVALAYHEARNVRHLRKAGHVERGEYDRLINLPTKREKAWKELQKHRVAARNARSARGVEEVFRKNFEQSLEDLADLFANPNWRGSWRGGNEWAGITRALIDLRDAIDCQDEDAVAALLATIPEMRHNTGVLARKLHALDGSV